MPRAVKEWIGKTPDSPIPPRVKLRILRRHDHICALSKVRIPVGETPEFDHIKPLRDDGEHRESNLQPVRSKEHKLKTAREAAERANADRIQRKAYGLNKPKKKFQGRGFDKKPKPEKLPVPGPRNLFERVG